MSKPCAVTDCNSAHNSNGYCRRHNRLNKLYGDPLVSKRAIREQTTAFIEAALSSDIDTCILWPFATMRGYGAYKFTLDGKTSNKAHVYICTIAHGPKPQNELLACHTCGVNQCVNPKHLRWCTAKENSADREAHGNTMYGETNPKAKLNTDSVLEIRRRAAAGEGQSALSREYGVTSQSVWAIVHRKTWKHV